MTTLISTIETTEHQYAVGELLSWFIQSCNRSISSQSLLINNELEFLFSPIPDRRIPRRWAHHEIFGKSAAKGPDQRGLPTKGRLPEREQNRYKPSTNCIHASSSRARTCSTTKRECVSEFEACVTTHTWKLQETGLAMVMVIQLIGPFCCQFSFSGRPWPSTVDWQADGCSPVSPPPPCHNQTTIEESHHVVPLFWTRSPSYKRKK